MTNAWMEELDVEQCLRLLDGNVVGRIASVVDGYPIVLPVNYRLVDAGVPLIVLRTREGNVIEHDFSRVAFEIDGIDHYRKEGWSVLVRGTLRMLSREELLASGRVDPQPWLGEDRNAWLAIEPLVITGRRLHGHETEWVFHAAAYL